MKLGTAFCPYCQKQVIAEKEGTNHILHLLLSVLTSGFWVIIWILCALSGEWRCSQCGRIVRKGTSSPMDRRNIR